MYLYQVQNGLPEVAMQGATLPQQNVGLGDNQSVPENISVLN
jgi:hypothetical protein